MERRIAVATAFNQKYTRYAYVMLKSLFMNHEKNEVSVYLFHSEILDSSKEELLDLAKQYENEMVFFHITDEMFPSELPNNTQWSKETYFRLFLGDLMPLNVDRVLYLDVDIIVNGSLKELFDFDMENKTVWACEDVSNIPFNDGRDITFKDQLDRGYRYFCAGVTLFDLNILRENYRFNKYFELARSLDFKLVAFDQDLLNLMHCDEVGYLEASKWELFAKLAYNHDVHYEEVKQAVNIIHFAGEKPWQGGELHYDIQKIWWDYAKCTPYYNEFLEEYLKELILNPYLYNSVQASLKEKEELQKQLDESMNMCKKLLEMCKG